MDCAISIIIYTIISILCITISYKNTKKEKSKLPILVILIISLLFVVLNIICTKQSLSANDGLFNHDRNNYYVEFLGYRKTSLGLTSIFNFVHLFSNNIELVFYISTFLCCFITFFAYKKSKDSNIYSLIFLLVTDFVFYTFVALKQCYTCAFASLLFVILFQDKFKYKDLVCIPLIFLSCIFHTSGFILIPIYIFFRLFEKKQINPWIICSLLLVLFIFLEPILNLLVTLTSNILPDIAFRIENYFYNGISFNNINSVFIKGFPFYYVTFLAVLNYKKLKGKVLYYDKYCLISIISSFFYLLSAFSYWMFRFVWLFYLPTGILFGILIKEEKNMRFKVANCILVYGSMLILLVRWLVLLYQNYNGF